MSELNHDADGQEQGEEIEIEAIGIDVSSQPIELYKVFKIANLVSGGGEAKHIITEGYVAVNGELETRKRRKMYDGDFFEFNQEYYVVVCDAPVTEVEDKPAKQAKPAPAKKSKKAPSNKARSDKTESDKTQNKKDQGKNDKVSKDAAGKSKNPHENKSAMNIAGLSQSADPSKKAKSQAKAKAEAKQKAPKSEPAQPKQKNLNGRGEIAFF